MRVGDIGKDTKQKEKTKSNETKTGDEKSGGFTLKTEESKLFKQLCYTPTLTEDKEVEHKKLNDLRTKRAESYLKHLQTSSATKKFSHLKQFTAAVSADKKTMKKASDYRIKDAYGNQTDKGLWPVDMCQDKSSVKDDARKQDPILDYILDRVEENFRLYGIRKNGNDMRAAYSLLWARTGSPVYFPTNKFFGKEGNDKFSKVKAEIEKAGTKLVREVGPFFSDISMDKHSIGNPKSTELEEKRIGNNIDVETLTHSQRKTLREYGRASIGINLVLSDVTYHDEWSNVGFSKLLSSADTWSAESINEKFKEPGRKRPAAFDGLQSALEKKKKERKPSKDTGNEGD
jgi:hypothetical protein